MHFSRLLMNDLPFAYEKIAPTTWAFLSSLLMLALFFKFNRFWSVRNFDLVLIVFLVPGILLVDHGMQLQTRIPDVPAAPVDSAVTGTERGQGTFAKDETATRIESNLEKLRETSRAYQRTGYYWLLSVCLVFLIRMLIDPMLVRRPLLAPNLTIGGLVFLGCSLMVFLFANIVTAQPNADDLSGAREAIKIVQREAAEETENLSLRKHGPGFPLFHLFPIIPTFSDGKELLETDADRESNQHRYAIAAKSLAILGQIAIVIALILIGYFQFSNFRLGVGMATIYLLLPYTAQYTGHVLHVLPGALILWAIVCFRKPTLAGIFVGLATGVSYYGLFLLPLWISFYWVKGVTRFVIGVVVSLAFCVVGLIFTSTDISHFVQQLQATFGVWSPITEGLGGIWGLGWDHSYRLPIMVAFAALCISFVFWPVRKNLGTLMAYTCAVMVGVQFWHGFQGGLLMAWYLPTALATIFRPNMEGRVAASELRDQLPIKKTETAEDLLPAA